MTYDLVVRDGLVIDGSGAPGRHADVAVSGGRIAAVGKVEEAARAEIDAEGRIVAPGFIDGHTHLDAQVFWDPLGTSASWHGVTTVAMGNCGFTLAPCAPAEKDLVLRNLERAEDIPREAMLAGIDWTWESYAEYLDAVERRPKGINFAGYVGHSAVRTYVMGERAFSEGASDDDLTAMRRVIGDALNAGALGFSTSFSDAHMTSDDRPVASRVAEWRENVALADVLREQRRGILQLTNPVIPDDDERHAYLADLSALALRIGRPVTYACVSVPSLPAPTASCSVSPSSRAAQGARVIPQVHSRQLISVMGLSGNLPFDRLEAWRELRGLGTAEQRAVFDDPASRARLVEAARRGPYREAIGTETRPPRYDQISIIDRAYGPWPSVAEVAADRGVDPVELMIDLALQPGPEQLFAHPFSNVDLDEVLDMLRNEHAVVALSDTGAHVSQIVDSSIPTFLLAYWVREREAFTWEAAIRMLTSRPAEVFGFADRGTLRPGLAADLVVFDPETVGPGMPAVQNDLPNGAPRLTQPAEGIDAVVVNGTPLLRDGAHSGAFPGQLLRAHRTEVGGAGLP